MRSFALYGSDSTVAYVTETGSRSEILVVMYLTETVVTAAGGITAIGSSGESGGGIGTFAAGSAG